MLKKILSFSPAVLFGGLFIATLASLYDFDESAVRVLSWLSSAGFVACIYVIAEELSRKIFDTRFKVNVILIIGCLAISTTTLLTQLKLLTYGDYIQVLVWVEGLTVVAITSLLWIKSLLISRERTKDDK